MPEVLGSNPEQKKNAFIKTIFLLKTFKMSFNFKYIFNLETVSESINSVGIACDCQARGSSIKSRAEEAKFLKNIFCFKTIKMVF